MANNRATYVCARCHKRNAYREDELPNACCHCGYDPDARFVLKSTMPERWWNERSNIFVPYVEDATHMREGQAQAIAKRLALRGFTVTALEDEGNDDSMRKL